MLFILVSIFPVRVSAYSDSEKQFSVAIPENYTVINSENLDSNKDFLEKINFSNGGFVNYLTTNNIVLYAIDKSNGSELVLKCIESDFAKNIKDMNLLDNEYVNTVAKHIITDNPFSVMQINDTKYFKATISSEDKGGKFFGAQYFTIKNGKLYSFSFTYPSNVSSEQASVIENGLIESLVINKKSNFNWSNFGDIIITVLLSLTIILFLVVAGYIIYTFVNDIRTKNSSNDVAPYVKIKRRKF